jgi:hypothetical protein
VQPAYLAHFVLDLVRELDVGTYGWGARKPPFSHCSRRRHTPSATETSTEVLFSKGRKGAVSREASRAAAARIVVESAIVLQAGTNAERRRIAITAK